MVSACWYGVGAWAEPRRGREGAEDEEERMGEARPDEGSEAGSMDPRRGTWDRGSMPGGPEGGVVYASQGLVKGDMR